MFVPEEKRELHMRLCKKAIKEKSVGVRLEAISIAMLEQLVAKGIFTISDVNDILRRGNDITIMMEKGEEYK
ncbi:hypothetical protein [Bacillus paranthracis]|uniref:hypothetical protein n=1 Tax=Bacillus paranthracis TaxID=2026186 RepID=UPI0021FB74EC|nr:hypothetical protein [Bacillus paranthracis]UXR28774.1 hypothetical protein [Bacillus phage Nachito]